MPRSELTIDIGAVRRNLRTLQRAAGDAQVWAVVKANGYGHGAVDVAGAALGAGAGALCVATVGEALTLRREFPDARVVVLGPAANREIRQAREARLELCVSTEAIPEGVRVHVKLDTGMGRWGLSELPELGAEVVGLMTHFATADTDLDFARQQLERFRAATDAYSFLERHAANSAATLRLPEAQLDAVRCGIALYGVSPFGGDPAEDGLEPVLTWSSELALVKRLAPGESTGYGRTFLADRETWVGIVPVGYADGFRRDLTGTQVCVGGELRRVVGTISMDAFAVELDGPMSEGTPVVLAGRGVSIEEHARHANTIGYELLTRIESGADRARRVVVDG
jgi:alanine racemase